MAERLRLPARLRALGVALALVGLYMGPAAAAESAAVVSMTDEMQFTPASVTIRVGETVEWHNGSVLVHTVTAVPARAAKAEDVALPPGAKPFNSGRLQPAATYRHTFVVPGTYRYFCLPHEVAGMIGEVIVTP